MGILTLMLTPGCALLQTPGEITQPADHSQETQAALALKLEAMSQRLDRLDQVIASTQEQGQQCQHLEDQLRQSLRGLQQEMRHTHRTIASLQKRMKWATAQSSPPKASLGERVEKQDPFWAVDAPLGELPNGGGQSEKRRIPALVPDKAREILVYTQIATGYVKGGAHRFRIAVQVQGDREAAFYLYAVGQPQSSWSYNSDNVWLPMPKNRELIVQAEGEPFFGDWKSDVRIIAYR